MNLDEQKIVRQILRSEFLKVQGKNPAYSQRAFAKKVGMNSGTLSSIMQGKRKLSATTANTILSRLKLEDSYRAWLTQALNKKKGESVEIERTLLDLDRFEIISTPLHLNALNLLRTAKAERTLPWVAKRLKKENEEIADVLERLERVGLVRKEGKKFIPTNQAVKTPDNFSHQAIRAFHKNTLAEAAEKLETVPMLLRDFSSITIPGDPAKIDQVRDLIKKFRDQVSFLLGAEPGSEVYKLSVQFYPVASEEERV